MNGKLSYINDNGATTAYTYDGAGNVLSETESNGFAKIYTYDARGNQTSFTLKQNGQTVTSSAYTYDLYSKMLSAVTDGVTTSYTYDLNGNRLTSTVSATGIVTSYTYNNANCVTSFVNTKAGVALSSGSYLYNTDGNQRQKTESGVTTAYAYDGAGRLTNEISTNGSISYAYDARSNRISMTRGAETTLYTYDLNNRLTSEKTDATVRLSTYDAAGNLLTSGNVSYSYDVRGRQTGYSDGTTAASYAYNPQGLRSQKTVGGATKYFVWSGMNIVFEYDGVSGAVYTYGLNRVSSGNSQFYLYNAHGDVIQLVNSTGAVVKTYTYDAFGNETAPTDGDANPFRYCGEYYDSSSGIYYLRNRYYSPIVGRFTQEDPIRSGLNWYAYCSNNPVMFIDPLGLVEVGLRAYAATYEGSTVSWNQKTGYVSVTYNGKTLQVKGTSENIRDGRIYVDDSKFVNAFGIGGKLIVYQDEVTGNVSIRGSFSYRGEDAYATILGSKTDAAKWGISYQKVFLKGIEEYWSGTFGEYNVSTYARYHGDGIKVSFNDKLGISNMTFGLFGWSTSNPGKITMYSGDSRGDGGLYSVGQYKWGSAHEFGHILGVDDAYNLKNSSSITSIYNSFGTGVQANDIAMVLNAWNTGKWQKWK